MKYKVIGATPITKLNLTPKLILILSLSIACCYPTNHLHSETLRTLNKKITTQEKELGRIQGELRNLKGKKKTLSTQEHKLIKSIKTLENKIRKTRNRRKKIERDLLTTQKDLKTKINEIESLDEQVNDLKQKLKTLLNVYYKEIIIPSLLGSRRDLLIETTVKNLIQKKLQILGEGLEKESTLKEHKTDLETKTKKMRREKQKITQKVRKSTALKAAKKKVYGKTKKQLTALNQKLKKLENFSKEITQLLDTLSKKKSSQVDQLSQEKKSRKAMLNQKGILPWPIEGKVIMRFGKQKHPELGIPIISNGIKLLTKKGSPIKSVYSGTVIYAKPFRAYGKTVIIDHGGDFVTVYGQLGKITVKLNDKVPPGKILGYTESYASSEFYFEIRNQGTSENPTTWLR